MSLTPSAPRNSFTVKIGSWFAASGSGWGVLGVVSIAALVIGLAALVGR